jgi:hypothetical protein
MPPSKKHAREQLDFGNLMLLVEVAEKLSYLDKDKENESNRTPGKKPELKEEARRSSPIPYPNNLKRTRYRGIFRFYLASLLSSLAENEGCYSHAFVTNEVLKKIEAIISKLAKNNGCYSHMVFASEELEMIEAIIKLSESKNGCPQGAIISEELGIIGEPNYKKISKALNNLGESLRCSNFFKVESDKKVYNSFKVTSIEMDRLIEFFALTPEEENTLRMVNNLNAISLLCDGSRQESDRPVISGRNGKRKRSKAFVEETFFTAAKRSQTGNGSGSFFFSSPSILPPFFLSNNSRSFFCSVLESGLGKQAPLSSPSEKTGPGIT